MTTTRGPMPAALEAEPVAAADPAERIRAALARLATTLSDVAVTADASARARCPHRGVRSRCFYGSACRNQVRRRAAPELGSAEAGGPDLFVCGGDACVRFEPVHGT